MPCICIIGVSLAAYHMIIRNENYQINKLYSIQVIIIININMKTVIEKIILNYFGKFINGINKDNLSVDLFGGNFQLENISLNQQFFDSLNTPFQLTYSSIGKLNLQAPLSKLSSIPVQCTLDNIYAVFQFQSDNLAKQQISLQKQMLEKKEFIQKYIREMFEDYLKKLRDKDEKKEDGMMAKLGKKIIDNLQLKIINLHIRFEQNNGGQKYSWGVTLQQISFMTTDKQWKPSFVDRIAQNGKNEKLLKKMNLKNLSVYWQSGSKQKNQLFVNELKSNSQKAEKMASMIKDSKYSILSLTSEVKLTINHAENFQTPLYELSVELDPIVFQLQKVQVSQMIDFTKKNITENEQISKNLSLKKKKTKKQLEPQQKSKLEATFQQYVENVLQIYQLSKERGKNFQPQDHEHIAILRTITNKVEDEEMLLWALKPIRKKVKQTRQKQLKKKKKGWFGGQYQLTQQETKALSNFVEQVTETDQKQRPPESLFFSIKVLIQGGKFAFVNNKNLPEEQKLQFQIGIIDIFLVKSQNDSLLDLSVDIQSICLNLYLPIYGSTESLKMNILKNMSGEEEEFFDPGQEQQCKFVSIKFCKKVQSNGNGNPVVKTDILGQVKQVAVTYKKIFMKKFKSFFTFDNFNQQMKNETMKKWQQIKQKNQDKNAQTEQENEVVKMFNIRFKIVSPLFVCPINQVGGWCINLGKLSIQSNRDNQKQIYPIKVQSAFFRYYPDLKYCFNKLNDKQLKQRQIFCLIQDMNFLITYTAYLYLKKQKTNIVLPNFQVNFTQKQYKNLISLKDIFKSDETESNFFQILKKQRIDVEKKKTYAGVIQKKSGELDKWKSFYGILSGEYIHLYGSEKQLKCLQKVPIKNLRLQYNEQKKIISLVHQQGIIQLTGAEFQNNVVQWRDRISAQMKQFMTIYQIVQQMASEENSKQMFRKRKDTGSMNVSYKKEKFLSFQVEKIGFNYKDDNNKDLMIFKLFGLVFEQKEQNRISNKLITIQKIESIDYLFSYKDPRLQTLIMTKQITLKIERNKNDDQKKMDIQFIISDIYINWKPDVLVILMKLIYSYLSKEIKHRVDDGQERTRDQLFQEVLSDPKFSFSIKQYERNSQGRQVKQKRINFVQKNKGFKQLIRLNLIIKKTQILMVHRQSHLVMFKMIANNIENELAMGENEKFVSGSIKQMKLYQMTGYPRENYTQNDKNTPYLIIKPRFQKTTQNLVQYKWSSYQSFVLPNCQRVNSFLYLTINPIQCEYFHQITFRLIDYILIQIILLLNQPEMVVANENLLQQMKKKQKFSDVEVKEQSQSIVKILFSQYEEVVRKIIDPYFMDMYFQLRNPSILLKPEKRSNFYHRAQFKNIIFVSDDRKNSGRFEKCECPEAKKYIYQQVYQIMCNKCHFFSVKEESMMGQKRSQKKQQILFDSVDVLLSINKLIMEDEINLIYPQLSTYDRSFKTQTKMSKLVIKKLTRQQYLLINKLVNFNMVYDDNKDQCFIHNFKITKLLSPKPIYYELLIPQIQLTGKEGNLDSDYNLFTMMMDGFRLQYNRNADLNSNFKIELIKANLVGYQYQLPELDPRRCTNAIIMIEQKVKAPKKIELMDFRPRQKQKYCTDITIKMKTTGEKIIQMNIQSIEAYLKIHLAQMVLQWCLLQDWVFPTVSIYANNITFHLTIHNMSAWLKQTLDSKSANFPRAFRLLGVFCYKFHRKAGFSQQHLEQQLKLNQKSFNQINAMPQNSYMSILLNTQVFHCLASNSINTKRQVVEKITFNMIQKRYFKVANQKLCRIKTMTNRKLNLDKGLFKFSFTDVFLMQDILSQISKDREYIGKLRQITNPNKVNQILQLQSSTDNQLSTLQNLEIDLESLSLYLINNCSNNFIPILRLHINNANISKSNTFRKEILKANFETAAYYFNANIFKWEPMLEKVDVIISKLIYRQQEENLFSSVETTKPILINISKQMMDAVRVTIQQWNRKHPNGKQHIEYKKISSESQNDKQKEKSLTSSPKKQRSIHETVELVSQYVIRNQIGYPIQIYSHADRKLLYRIDHLQQVDYEYELEKYDDEGEIQILIGVQICHNKHKFKRITHISLGGNLNFNIKPQLQNRSREETERILPRNSLINFITETKDQKRYLTLKTTKWIEDYLNNRKDIYLLPFDHKQTIVLAKNPHNGIEVSLYKTMKQMQGEKSKGKDKNKQRMSEMERFRYIGSNGVLKIMGYAMVYNYTPIPLNVNGFFVLPDQFLTIYEELTINNKYYKECNGVKVEYNKKDNIYYIYCEGYIIDYAGLYYELPEAKQFSYQMVKNNVKFNIYLLPNSNQIKVRLQKKLKSKNNIKCSAIIKPSVGNQLFQLQNYNNSLCQYQTYGYLSSFTGNEHKDFKKIIEVSPRYVLSNTTSYMIKVCQIQSQESLILQPNERIPFYWENNSKPKQIKIAALKQDKMWGYSGPLSIDRNTHSFVVRNPSTFSDYRILSLQIQNTNTINFIHIVDCHPKKGNNIMLCNQVNGVILRFYQQCIKKKDYELLNPSDCIFIVKARQEQPFGYQIPKESHRIVMEVIFQINNPQLSGAFCAPIVVQNIQNSLFEQRIQVTTKDNNKKYFLLKLSFEGNVKKLQFKKLQKPIKQIRLGEFICKIPSLVVSLIGYQNKIRKQIINVHMGYIQIQSGKNNKITEYTFILREFQIQNCLNSSPFFPVIFQSSPSTNVAYFLQFTITKDNFNSKLIHYIGVSLNRFILSITSQQVQALQQNIAQITKALNYQVSGTSLQTMRQYQMFKKPDEQLSSSMYFVQAEVQTLKFNVTFKHVNNWGGRLLKTFASIDNCNVTIPGKKIYHFSSRNFSQFLVHLKDHYQEGIKKVILPMIGNLAILGSPLSLAQRIGSGFKDLIQLPSQGFNVSPLQGSKGLAKGAGSLFKNTFQGTFNSFQSVTGSVGNGLSSLAFDQQFSKQRQKIQNQKSQHIGQGLAYGAKSLANGIFKGITGVITTPVQEAQEKGVGGFFIGSLKGLTGLVVKPVSGLFDATTKTFQGIKNTPQFLGSKNQKAKNKRDARVFYTYNREFRSYDQDIPMCARKINKTYEQKYQNLSWYGIYQLANHEKSKQKRNTLLLVTYEYFIIYNLQSESILKVYNSQDLFDAKVQSPNEVRLILYDIKSKKFGHLVLELKQPLANKLASEIKSICNCYRPIYGFNYELHDYRKEASITQYNDRARDLK